MTASARAESVNSSVQAPAQEAVAYAQDPANTTLAAGLASLQDAGARQLDPARFYFLERLLQRMDDSPGDVQRLLGQQLQAALAAYGERFEQSRQKAMQAVGDVAAAQPGTALAELNQYIRTRRQQDAEQREQHELGNGLPGDEAASADMASVQRFKKAWSQMATDDQVGQALERAPVNAGPLNSHRLVVDSLALMRKLSPEYMRRVVSYIDTLLWLDQASQKYAPAKARAARRSRSRK